MAAVEHAVIVHIPLADSELDGEDEQFDLSELEDGIFEAVEAAGVGEHDGHGSGADELELFSYGPDADRLWEVIRGVLVGFDLPSGVWATKRYGPADDPAAREERVEFG